jgi:hypothetical protein
MIDGGRRRRRPWNFTPASSGPVSARANMAREAMSEVLRLHISLGDSVTQRRRALQLDAARLQSCRRSCARCKGMDVP